MTKQMLCWTCGLAMAAAEEEAGVRYTCPGCEKTRFVGTPTPGSGAPIPSRLAHRMLKNALGGSRIQGRMKTQKARQ